MVELLTAAQMRAIEQAAIESGEVTGLELMERAGRAVVEAIFEEWPELAKTSHRAVVLCGPGNNGGDGFVVARLLKEWGWEVEVFLYGDPEKMPPDAKVNYERWLELGSTAKLDQTPLALEEYEKYAVIVDAVFGTGLSRGLDADVAKVAKRLYDNPIDLADRPLIWLKERTVAVDIPSGYCSDSGIWLGDNRAFEAALTVTFHEAKLGHCLFSCPDDCGRVTIKDIGLGSRLLFSDQRLLDYDEVSFGWRPIEKPSTDHKYNHGHAIVLSGGSGQTGAARLAARGALRIGAGLVTLGVPPSAQQEVASQVTALMLTGVQDGTGLTETLKDERLNALCLGPALGKGARERALILAALEAKRPTVLDADALTPLFFDEADALFGKLHDQCVLTPHGGEFARMFPDIAEKLNAPATKGPAYSKVDATREAAARAGCVVLFKGPDTVIAAPDGRCSINSAHYERAAPWLATAGSGDVLAGFITGLLARGFEPIQAAETAAWLHVECARSFGPGLIAEDLPEELPKVFSKLGL
ncbi:MAG: NAD(P)H-hydrate dehydratase [Pseudomonadota bacterium]